MMSSGINLVMTVIGFAMSTMFIVFICTRLICGRIQHNASRRTFHLASRSDLSIMERGLHGLEPVVVSNFPTKKYGDMFSTVDDTQCVVCLTEYHHEDVLRILPNCGHSFHANCIDIWLHQHCTCPVCRISLREYSEKKRIMQPLFSSAFRSFRGPEQLLVHSPNCVYAGQSYHTRTVGLHHAGPVQEDSGGSRNTITESQEIISTVDDEQDWLSRNKKGKRLENPSNGQVSQN
ncbi:hypothetical protein SAY87_007820 [Trapa incisa]|uniref:RING-type domain-containing protein n=1 Tax=Trapa incisa TaxID=236973 RepID=A0AAN7KK14_9MYRT|nr:hypothetical protein SAY87_007820 [Trapa incisa]